MRNDYVERGKLSGLHCVVVQSQLLDYAVPMSLMVHRYIAIPN